MFFAILFLILAAVATYLFPVWSWAAVLATAFACTATFRLVLWLANRAKKATADDKPS
jgi:hypothetical protein